MDSVGRVIAIAGPPNSGKSSQGERLAERLGAVYLSTGQLLRDEANPQLMATMGRGDLVPAAQLERLLGAAIAAVPAAQMIVMDGPKKPQEADWLMAKLPELGRRLERVVLLQISEAVARRRSLKRGRYDEAGEVLNERWRRYREETMLGIERYRSAGLVTEVDAYGSPGEVARRIALALGLNEV